MGSIDLDAYRRLEEEGFLNIGEHPSAPLLIHNYSQKTQYERFWTPETLMSRGLVTDLEGKIVARPFRKFFNLEEHIEHFGPLPQGPFDVYEKMDGSLGILFFHEDMPVIATRGSFGSMQAMKARDIFDRKYRHLDLDPSVTYLFEIIYPENRIVVDYGGTEDLVLLGMVETRSGLELPLQEIGLPLVKRYEDIGSLDQLQRIQEENREGFVVRFQSGLRVKVKFEEYVRLHRIITGVNARLIWEYMKDGILFDEMLEKVPDEFYQWVKTTRARLQAEYEAIEARARAEFRTFATRKESALYYQSCTYPAILFKMLDNKDYSQVIWRMIRPDHETAFLNDADN